MSGQPWGSGMLSHLCSAPRRRRGPSCEKQGLAAKGNTCFERNRGDGHMCPALGGRI